MSYSYNGVPIIPGAYLVNGTTTNTNTIYHMPIFSTISRVDFMSFNDQDNLYYILPGYKLELFPNSNFGGTSSILDNTNGTKIRYVNSPSPLTCTSLKMYYNNVEILEQYTYTGYAANSGSTTTTSTSQNRNGPYKLLDMPIFPGAYLNDAIGYGTLPIFYSISDLSTISSQTPNSEDSVLVFPGYKLIMWDSINYAGTYVAIDNTNGSSIIVGLSSTFSAGAWNNNTISSCQLFYNGNEVLQTDIIS